LITYDVMTINVLSSLNHICGVMVGMLGLSAVDHGLEPWLV